MSLYTRIRALFPPSQAQIVCWEAYQVVGSLLSDLDKFGTPEGDKILDNLAAARLVHRDVLPWASYEPVKFSLSGGRTDVPNPSTGSGGERA